MFNQSGILQLFSRFLKPKAVPKYPKTVFLHIGIAKTGTTSIQQMLTDNREILRQQGYFYPALSGLASHYVAYYFGFGSGHALADFNQKKPRNEHEAFIRDKIHLQISENENMILSSEAFSSATKKEDISQLTDVKNFFPGRNFVIIAY